MAKISIMLIYVMYEMIMFVIFHDLHVDEYGNRQEPYGCLFYCMTRVSILKCHVIALLYRYELAIVVVATRGGDNRVPCQGPRRHAGVMEIMPVHSRWRSKRRKRLYHITLYM